MGDAACQLTKGFHFHGLPQFFFRLDSRRDIGLDADEELRVSGIIADRTQLISLQNAEPSLRCLLIVIVIGRSSAIAILTRLTSSGLTRPDG